MPNLTLYIQIRQQSEFPWVWLFADNIIAVVMVLERHPKKYKHLMRIMLTQLVEHEHITTTKAKARHLRKHGEKLFEFARKAALGQTSPLNLLKSRIHTEKARTKLLVDLMPRLKQLRGGFLTSYGTGVRRKGDNAPMAIVAVKGNEKTEFQKKRRQQAIEKGEIFDAKAFKLRILQQQKQFFEKKAREAKEAQDKSQAFFKSKVHQVNFQQLLANKTKKQPTIYARLI